MFVERLTALGLIVGSARLLPGLAPLLLLVLAFIAFRRSVMREAASRVAEALAEESDSVTPLTVGDLLVDLVSVVVMAVGAAGVPAVWAFPLLGAGAGVLAHNAPRRAASRLMDSVDRKGPKS
jgi:hypothetical protein